MTQADICRIANVLRQFIWRQNVLATKNARSRSKFDDDDIISEVSIRSSSSEKSPPISSRRRSTQRRVPLSHGSVSNKPILGWSAERENDDDGGNHGTFIKVYNASAFDNTRLLLTTLFNDRDAEIYTVSRASNVSNTWRSCSNRLNGLTNTRAGSLCCWLCKQTLCGECKSTADNTSFRHIPRIKE